MHRISHFEILTNRSVLIQAKTERFISDLRRLVQLLEAGIETEEERVGVFDLKCENYPVSARQLRLRRDNLMATISRLEGYPIMSRAERRRRTSERISLKQSRKR